MHPDDTTQRDSTTPFEARFADRLLATLHPDRMLNPVEADILCRVLGGRLMQAAFRARISPTDAFVMLLRLDRHFRDCPLGSTALANRVIPRDALRD